MQKITLCNDVVLTDEAYKNKIRLTPAGKLALITPFPMKQMVSNNRRDRDGKNYLSSSMKEDDLQISVQFCILNFENYADIQNVLSEFIRTVKTNMQICGVDVLYKGITTPTKSGDYVMFNANLIKYHKTKTE